METTTIPTQLFHRMTTALIKVEEMLSERDDLSKDWVSEEAALKLLGCSQRQLYRIKGNQIKYKSVGRKHEYSKKSIEKYNDLMSS
jgi:hypothetical protein